MSLVSSRAILGFQGSSRLNQSLSSKAAEEFVQFVGGVEVSFEVARSPDDISAALESFLPLEASGWKGQRGTALLQNAGDATFIRRVFLDLCGKLPAVNEVRAFLADGRADKRARLIDRCLEDPDHAAFLAMRWGSILHNSASKGGSEPAAYAFHAWLRDMIGRNRPYD